MMFGTTIKPRMHDRRMMTAPTVVKIPGTRNLNHHRFLPYVSYSASNRVDKKFAINLKDRRIKINNFRNVGYIHYSTVMFFFTNTYTVTLLDFMENNFLQLLVKKPGWRLYIPEIVLEYLRYLQKVEHSFWNPELPPTILEDLVAKKQILILREVPETIKELSSSGIMTANVGYFHPEYLSIEIHLKSHKVEMPTPKRPVVNMKLMNTVKFSNELPHEIAVEEELHQTPVSRTRRLSCSWRTSRLEGFRTEMERLRTRMEEQPTTHFEVGIIAPNEFVAFWYLRQFWVSLKLKTHVTQPMAEFARKFFPNAEDYIFSDNSDEKCRLHYDCCVHTSNEMCVPNQEWAIEFEVERIFIGHCNHSVEAYNEFEMLQNDFRLSRQREYFHFPFIHPELEECDHT